MSLALAFMIVFFHHSSQACFFRGMSYTELTPANGVTLLSEGPSPFSQSLFNKFSDRLGEFVPDECQNALVRKTYRHTASGTILTLLHTTQDECDGGNTFGLIIEGSGPDPRRVIATIEDSFIRCGP
jgi:hypothetical protein